MIAAPPPIAVSDARAAIVQEYPGDRVDHCRRETSYSASCRTITPKGIIIEITDDDGRLVKRAYEDLTTRVKATKKAGTWRFTLIALGPRLPSGIRAYDLDGPVRREIATA